jgi:ATP-dependent DNA helicase RecG
MTRDELESLREGWVFEAKLAAGRDGRGALPLSMWETYSAFANTDGGIVALGVKEHRDGKLEIAGIEDIEKVERDLWTTLQNPAKVSVNLLTNKDVRRETIDGKTILLIDVPRASRDQRPVYLDGSLEQGAYIRVNDGDHRMGREVARRMLADAQPNRDAQVETAYAAADLHPESVQRYRNLFASQRPEHPFLVDAVETFLFKIGAVEKGPTGTMHPTLGGLLMLGDERALRRRFPNWHLSFKEVGGDPNDATRWMDRIAPDGTWNANVFEFYMRAIHKLHAGLKVPFALEAGQFRKDETLSHAAVREAFLNCLIHADYQGTAGVRAILRPDGFDFINPGLPLVSTEQVWRGGRSEARNPVLQKLFGYLQLGEREGSGGPAIKRAWASQHWTPPTLVVDAENVETHLVLSQTSLLPTSSLENVQGRLGARFDSLDELGRLVLVTANAEGGVTHARIKELTSVHSRDITLKLQDLLRRDFLDASGPARRRVYRLLSSSEESLGSSDESSEESLTGSEERSTSSEETLLGTRGWAPKETLVASILGYCQDDWRTLSEISAHVGRTPSTVRTEYLRDLIADGRLERLHRESPKHPAQAYRTARDNR